MKPKLEPIIKGSAIVKDFTIGKKQIRVLKGLDFEIEPGEFVMISGPSGCGKSTLMNVINGWEGPTGGELLVAGQDIYNMPPKDRINFMRKHIGMVHQAAFWVQSLSVIDNVAIPALLKGVSKSEARERGKELLKILGLEQFTHYKPADLSGGQQQRVSLLRSLVNNPMILLADEPTGNLDSKSSDILMNLFCAINAELGRTIVMVTHNVDLLDYATKVIYIKDGQILKIETKSAVCHKRPTGEDIGDILDLAKKNIIQIPREEEEEEERERAAVIK